MSKILQYLSDEIELLKNFQSAIITKSPFICSLSAMGNPVEKNSRKVILLFKRFYLSNKEIVDKERLILCTKNIKSWFMTFNVVAANYEYVIDMDDDPTEIICTTKFNVDAIRLIKPVDMADLPLYISWEYKTSLFEELIKGYKKLKES
ncbi:unnamed protein product [marine sediment metagenome]|uniref:Uncharacterized protein n=1 Tax=marine sediment metagenome TaxID=412755 RepID=X0SDI0_9ZZZZ